MAKLTELLKELYPKDTSRIIAELRSYKKKVPSITPQFPHPLWYRHTNMYVLYPDAVYRYNNSFLQSIIPYFAHIKEIGCTAVHLLPFLDSPMVDKGFDIKDFYTVRPELGTMEDLRAVKKTADEQGLRLFMDLVFNHVSEEHEWFQKAQAGDEYYRNFFIHTTERPVFIRTFHKEAAVWAEYEIEGKKRAVNIAFPETAGEIPHWRQGTDGVWYYHTYYPQQIDVNWLNPDVFIAFAKVLLFWAGDGWNFRLDAIPFVGKDAYKQTDCEHERTFALTAALHKIARDVNPEVAFIVETYESLDTVLEYFGSSNLIQAELSYNFHLCTQLWVTLIKKDPSYLWDIISRSRHIPHHAEWINFLRNHDELSLAYLPDELKDDVSAELMPRGASFREGYGISGRTYSLLGNDEKRFMMAYFLLFSLPGSVAIPYGDDVGKRNVPISKLAEQEQKDTRNINRGKLTKDLMNSHKANRIKEKLKGLLICRERILLNYLNILPHEMKSYELPKGVFSAIYHVGTSKLIVLVNLDKRKKTIKMDATAFKTVNRVNQVTRHKDRITLGPYGGLWLQR